MEPMKIDRLNTLFICSFCKNTFREPVILPCFEIICKCDLDQIRIDRKTVCCPFCDQNHSEPENGFQIDKRIAELIKLEVNKLDFGKTFNNGKRLLSDLEERINELDKLIESPQNYLTEYFSNLKTKSDSRREFLFMVINEHFDQINAEISKCEQDCKQSIRIYDDVKIETSLLKKHLDQWSKDYDSLRLNEEKRDEIISKSYQAKSELETRINEIKHDLLQNLAYSFQSDEIKLKEKSFFGSVVKSFCVRFENFANFKENDQLILESNKFNINGFKWNLEIKHKLGGFMGCYLYCDSKK